MAAAIALGKALAEPTVDIISSFLDTSSVAATCGKEALDTDALADVIILAHCPSFTQTPPQLVYLGSLELTCEWIWSGSMDRNGGESPYYAMEMNVETIQCVSGLKCQSKIRTRHAPNWLTLKRLVLNFKGSLKILGRSARDIEKSVIKVVH